MRNAAETTIAQLIIRLSAATVLAAAVGSQSLALSELRPGDEPSQPEKAQSRAILQAFDGTTLPQPGPAINRSAQAGDIKPTAPTADPNAAKSAPADSKPAEIIRDMTKLPAPVKHMREQLVEAAASGDITRLRALMGTGATQTQVMNGEFEDPIETLKSFSGDAEGQEILAILLDILSTGAAHFDVGTPDEAYVWPYFAGKQLSTLTPPERVDLLRIVTAGDLAGMEENGNYNFFRTGISPDGKWKFFSGGD
ncbi:hypothetical protein [Neorhizobium galegae]|uniref:hypothetical protein n=1 Tax=Neorhizobium galegae TaxID=399 RepID=UPI00062293B5|nr:hypothetical protein [Neorhizobium galegae]CDZ30492.1 Hypothetical protein NGAL_HAMBI490_53610 [Neorhizobium galegae bv. officinalis]KAA9386506.1 hypothetical protein F4V88_08510 [Neorhizobium galegae]KAB1111098.1 hypothetical protein F4V89_22005 [Neorhizobium galegae]MCM2498602.1 hypothetical protein [Neorhizobium galegae]MCQ1772242.1 hypothetical protein [Neorhizobium galegae]